MSLLNSTQLLSKASLIVESPKNIVNTLFNGWDYAFNLLHGNPADRQALLNIIGTNGAELFNLNSILTTFMVTQLSGVRNDLVEQIQTKLKFLPNFNFNPDGTVTEISVTVPTASTINFGQPLSSSNLTGGSAAIPGSFSFVDSSLVLQSGSNSVLIKFVPTSNNYKTTYYNINVQVNPPPTTIESLSS